MKWFTKEGIVVDLLRDSNKRLTQETEWLRTRVHELTDQVLEMKREGFQYTPIAKRQEELLPEIDERILVAIRSRAGEGTKMERELFEFAATRSIMGDETEDIVDLIHSGGLDD